MNYLIISIFLGIIILIMAGVAIYHKESLVAIIATGAVGLFASVLFLMLAAPDVAMTEAAIGSGLSTVVFFYVLNKIRRDKAEDGSLKTKDGSQKTEV